jgi:hypothetical protein
MAVLLDGAGRVAFNPLVVVGCTVWLASYAEAYQDAARTTRALADDDPVGALADRSGNGNHFAQATAAKKPTLKPGGQGGRMTARFDGVDDYLESAVVALGGTTGLTLFAVLKAASSGADAVVHEASANFNSNNGAFVVAKTSGEAGTASTQDGGTYSNFTTSGLITGWCVLSVLLDRALASNEVTVWINGVSAGSRADNNNLAAAFQDYAHYLGMRAGTGLPLGMDFGELLLYGRALADVERRTVERGLGRSWGIAVS